MDINLFSLLIAASFKWENMISGPCFDLCLVSKVKYFRKELDSVKTVFCFYAASFIYFFLINVIKNVVSAFIKVARNLNVCVVQMKE